MTSVQPLEMDLLKSCVRILEGLSPPERGNEHRYQVLEAASSSFGGFDLKKLWSRLGTTAVIPSAKMKSYVEPLVSSIIASNIPPALVLSALAREGLKRNDKRKTGSFNTDFRLALRLAGKAKDKVALRGSIIDPAAGSGMLLAAICTILAKGDKVRAAKLLQTRIYAADVSAGALRGAMIALASLTDDVDSICKMYSKWRTQDSLLATDAAWKKMEPKGFDLVLANPPWEKMKLSRHEYAQANGSNLHYGDQPRIDDAQLRDQRKIVDDYAEEVINKYPMAGGGEPDLYVAFIELFIRLLKTDGAIVALLPGGLIRSHSLLKVRQKLFNEFQGVEISIFDNRSRFFGIDSRFKFLLVDCRLSAAKSIHHVLKLNHEWGLQTATQVQSSVSLRRSQLKSIRNDLTLPEVRTREEWALFSRLSLSGDSLASERNGWRAEFCREIDMTHGRSLFVDQSVGIPLVEGRMVNQHRVGVKEYVSGTGRRALWRSLPPGKSRISPQFFVVQEGLSQSAKDRICRYRAGFCDIAGQTNERSMMAALIGPGIVCGNKVPTLVFPDDDTEERMLLWIGIVNSFWFDWLLRRVLTTTINYFVLRSIPLPKISRGSYSWRRIIKLCREIREYEVSGVEARREIAELRAAIDVEVAVCYRLNVDDALLMLSDFPSIDRKQIALQGEWRSTVTKDLVLWRLSERLKEPTKEWSKRCRLASAAGAVAFLPADAPIELSVIVSDKNELESYGRNLAL